VIGGNEDPEGVVLKDLSPAPVARALRVYPRAPRAMSVCLRLELYGCPWEAGLLSYTAPRGHVMALDPVPIVLNDSTYDGFSAGPLHFGGLGQLSDGVLGLDDFLRTRERRLWPGYDYVGWPRPPGPHPHVELEFEFQELRTFHAMQVHCNNLHTRGVGIFRAVECRFKKILATAWEPLVVTHSMAGATKDPSARSVTVPLGGRHARFIQCRFFFGAEWMLFSEVSFVSEVLDDPMGASGWPPTPDPSSAILENVHDGGGANNADVTGGSAYALAGPAHSPAHSPALPTFPRDRLRFREKLGEGQFGEVCPGVPRCTHVSLGAPRRDFLQEARALWRLRDPNIVRLLGVCGGPGPLCIVTEYMEHGDLHQFLGGARGHALSLATLVQLGAQIAAGMRFLAARNFVHRDLATRNCLVGEGLRVKVADFGMSRSLYGTEYCRVRGRALLPIRWMAWESILWGTFSPASDAWAFGVTLWEVLTRCREQPYGALSDEQVIANAGHHFQNRGQQVSPRSARCILGVSGVSPLSPCVIQVFQVSPRPRRALRPPRFRFRFPPADGAGQPPAGIGILLGTRRVQTGIRIGSGILGKFGILRRKFGILWRIRILRGIGILWTFGILRRKFGILWGIGILWKFGILRRKFGILWGTRILWGKFGILRIGIQPRLLRIRIRPTWIRIRIRKTWIRIRKTWIWIWIGQAWIPRGNRIRIRETRIWIWKTRIRIGQARIPRGRRIRLLRGILGILRG
ncbi:epithelial discoidin domain-containing receptor 1-like, partial [Geospiza fortis]|uniref:Epithelial discoidin domain-containing receptor 1-like n=1 Tax=Geospiza fortis TaxID=48883 RepID=A0A6I9ZCI6_GEOFO